MALDIAERNTPYRKVRKFHHPFTALPEQNNGTSPPIFSPIIKTMAEHLDISNGTKSEKYATLLPQIAAVVEVETDLIARMANVAAMIHETFGFLWTGFYRVESAGGQLILGPFQGPMACTRIKHGRGVCGKAWSEGRTLVVPDVEAFPGHIACSSSSRSEIVVPLWKEGEIVGVLDIDSADLATFDATDARHLEEIAALVTDDAK